MRLSDATRKMIARAAGRAGLPVPSIIQGREPRMPFPRKRASAVCRELESGVRRKTRDAACLRVILLKTSGSECHPE